MRFGRGGLHGLQHGCGSTCAPGTEHKLHGLGKTTATYHTTQRLKHALTTTRTADGVGLAPSVSDSVERRIGLIYGAFECPCHCRQSTVHYADKQGPQAVISGAALDAGRATGEGQASGSTGGLRSNTLQLSKQAGLGAGLSDAAAGKAGQDIRRINVGTPRLAHSIATGSVL